MPIHCLSPFRVRARARAREREWVSEREIESVWERERERERPRMTNVRLGSTGGDFWYPPPPRSSYSRLRLFPSRETYIRVCVRACVRARACVCACVRCTHEPRAHKSIQCMCTSSIHTYTHTHTHTCNRRPYPSLSLPRDPCLSLCSCHVPPSHDHRAADTLPKILESQSPGAFCIWRHCWEYVCERLQRVLLRKCFADILKSQCQGTCSMWMHYTAHCWEWLRCIHSQKSVPK